MSSICETTKTRKCFVIQRFHSDTKYYCGWYKWNTKDLFRRLNQDKEFLHFVITSFSVTKETIGLSDEEEQIFSEIKEIYPRKCFVNNYSIIIPMYHFFAKNYIEGYKIKKKEMFRRLKEDRERLHYAITSLSVTKNTIGLSDEEEQIFKEIKALIY